MLGTSRAVAGGQPGHDGHPFPDNENVPGRKLRFALVGGACFAVQLAILRLLGGAGVGHTLANAVGFATSAQLNFALSSSFTWAVPSGARVGPAGPVVADDRRVLAQWGSYELTALVALGVNTLAFAAAVGTVGEIPAAVAGVGTGTVVTFLVCDRLIFRARPAEPPTARPAASRARQGVGVRRRPPAGHHVAGAARHLAAPIDPGADQPRPPSPTAPWSTP